MHGGGGGVYRPQPTKSYTYFTYDWNILASVQMNEYDTIYTCTLKSTMQYNVDFELKR